MDGSQTPASGSNRAKRAAPFRVQYSGGSWSMQSPGGRAFVATHLPPPPPASWWKNRRVALTAGIAAVAVAGALVLFVGAGTDDGAQGGPVAALAPSVAESARTGATAAAAPAGEHRDAAATAAAPVPAAKLPAAAVPAAALPTAAVPAAVSSPARPPVAAKPVAQATNTDNRAARPLVTVQLATAMRGREPADRIAPPVRLASLPGGRLYAFSELQNLSGQQVFHRWERQGRAPGTVPFEVRADRWRVYSSKVFKPGDKGLWRLAVTDSAGRALASREFFVE